MSRLIIAVAIFLIGILLAIGAVLDSASSNMWFIGLLFGSGLTAIGGGMIIYFYRKNAKKGRHGKK